MPKKVTVPVAILALVALAAAASPHPQQNKYIRIIGDRVNIRFAPSTSSVVVAFARAGDIFELADMSGDWYEIYMFSGEARYVHKSLAVVSEYRVTLPQSVATRRTVFKAFVKAEDRATAEADRRYPPTNRQNIERNIDYQRILDDRYKLDVTQQHGVQPPIYRKLVAEGLKNGWLD